MKKPKANPLRERLKDEVARRIVYLNRSGRYGGIQALEILDRELRKLKNNPLTLYYNSNVRDCQDILRELRRILAK